MKTNYFLAIMLLVSPPAFPGALKNSIWDNAAAYAGINVSTLYGIAVQESGMRWRDGSFRPWPWTLNVNKDKNGVKAGARRYADRRTAERALTRLIRLGINNVDVGLMQVNLRWHGDKVHNGLSLLDPLTNIKVAATIIRDVNDSADLSRTVARYHSFDPVRGQAYARHVKRYEKIINASIN
jgi:soluble lytic murein transglycosylase-like protein